MEPPEEFPFPFVPYVIQKDFMRNLYLAIKNHKIGIFESPTGTGKSMSLICGSLTWLRDYEHHRRKELDETLFVQASEASSVDSEEPDWISEFILKQDSEKGKAGAKNLLTKLKAREINLKKIRENAEDSLEPKKKRAKYSGSGQQDKDETLLLIEQAKKQLERRENELDGMADDDHDFDLILDDYQSDEESDLPGQLFSDTSDNEDFDNGVQKIYYCSRTHSQLTQFIRELQKSPYNNQPSKEFFMTAVPLASRQSLCINKSVRKLSSVQQMNDKCLDLQKNSSDDKGKDKDSTGTVKKSKSAASCPFKTVHGVESLSNRLLGKIQDIEEAVENGKEISACPYYAARQAVPLAQLIIVPYQILLHSSTRKASGINLKDSVVIIDEAHNLVDTISNIHSIEVTCSQVQRAYNQLTQYMRKYNKRLKAENLMYVKRILFIQRKLLMIMGIETENGDVKGKEQRSDRRNAVPKTTLMRIHDFLFKANLDNINLFKVLRYCKRSMISRKLNGFVEKYASAGCVISKQEKSSLSKFISNATKVQEPAYLPPSENSTDKPIMRSPLMHIENFLLSLTSANEDGRIAITTLQPNANANYALIREVASIKFMLLNPAPHFQEIVEECKSVIVAGGTMKPSSSFTNQLLFPIGVPKERIFEFSCGHVIEKDQLLPVVLTHGPSRQEFEFTYEKRKNMKLVFRETKKGGQIDHILKEYFACIQRSRNTQNGVTGALLLSVVGGKMSEGINFSDDLGRCVVMVGLPYPNMYSAELREKMAYLDANMPKVGLKTAGQSYYENLCMKAVNQSIGRAIRHRNDHACIVLVDKRYARADIQSQLPGWISDKLTVPNGFGGAFASIRKFFITKKTP